MLKERCQRQLWSAAAVSCEQSIHSGKLVGPHNPNNFPLTVYLCNAQGLTAKKECLQYRIETDLRNTVVCITETFLTRNHLSPAVCDFRNFSVFRLDRDNFAVRKKCGGGLLILVPSFLSATLFCDPFCIDGVETLCVDLFPRQNRRQPVHLCLVYRSPEHFDPDKALLFCRHISSIISDATPTILLGDFNIPSVQWSRNCVMGKGPNALETRFLNLTIEKGLSQLTPEPTRGDNLLDLVFSSEPFLISTISVEEPFGGSDHKAVHFTSTIYSSPEFSNRTRYDYRRADYVSIAQALDQTDWPSVFQSCSTVQQMWDAFLDHLRPLIDQFVPQTQVKARPGRKWSQRIRSLFRKQKLLHRRYKCSPSDANFNSWKSAAKEA